MRQLELTLTRKPHAAQVAVAWIGIGEGFIPAGVGAGALVDDHVTVGGKRRRQPRLGRQRSSRGRDHDGGGAVVCP